MEHNIDETSETNKNMSHPSPLHPDLGKELPFLITHYLANFGYNVESNGDSPNDVTTKNDLLTRIQRLGHELSDSFHKLGSFGTTITHVSK